MSNKQGKNNDDDIVRLYFRCPKEWQDILIKNNKHKPTLNYYLLRALENQMRKDGLLK